MKTDLCGVFAESVKLVAGALDGLVATMPDGVRALLHSTVFIQGIATYIALLVDASRKVNLTSDVDPGHLLATHIPDSLAPLLAGIPAPKSLLDIGTGGGFPAVPLALAWPRASVTMTESIAKKARFLERCVVSVPLPHSRVVHGRVEDPSSGLPRHSFDMVTARGVGNIATLLSYAVPLLSRSGRLVLWKGERDVGELASPAVLSLMRQARIRPTVIDYALPHVERNSKLIILQVAPDRRASSPGRNRS